MTLNPNEQEVKRPYRSPRRVAQAEATRHAILDAAHHLFLANGYATTSIKAIAQSADVSDQTVYSTFGDKASLLAAVGLRVVSGELAADSTGGRDLAADLLAAPTQSDRIQIAAQWSRMTYEQGMLEFEAMMLDAAGTDPRAAELAEALWKQKYDDNKQLFALVFPPDQLPPGDDFDEAYDLFFAIDNAAFIRTLIHDRGWSWDTYQRMLVTLLTRLFATRETSEPRQ